MTEGVWKSIFVMDQLAAKQITNAQAAQLRTEALTLDDLPRNRWEIWAGTYNCLVFGYPGVWCADGLCKTGAALIDVWDGPFCEGHPRSSGN